MMPKSHIPMRLILYVHAKIIVTKAKWYGEIILDQETFYCVL
jgi:hypothetical protein